MKTDSAKGLFGSAVFHTRAYACGMVYEGKMQIVAIAGMHAGNCAANIFRSITSQT
jgi:hypothetical protein